MPMNTGHAIDHVFNLMWCWLCSRHASRTRAVRSCDRDLIGLDSSATSPLWFSISFPSLSLCPGVGWCFHHAAVIANTWEKRSNGTQWQAQRGLISHDAPHLPPSVFMLCENSVFFSVPWRFLRVWHTLKTDPDKSIEGLQSNVPAVPYF